MDNLRTALNIVLSKIPPSEMLEAQIRYDDIDEKTFVRLAGYYITHYSNDELRNLFRYIENEYNEQTDYLRGFPESSISHEMKFNIFNIILLFASEVLTEQDGNPCCKYEHLLRWRMTSHQLDEDVFTTAFLANKDIHDLETHRTFSWRSIITHNNQYLKNILAKGMAENHFHLKGSAPQFPLSWLYMMNHVTSRKTRKILEQYAKERLSVSYFTGKNENHLYISYLKAALIRSFLYAKLTKKEFALGVCKESEILEILKNQDEIIYYRTLIQENISDFMEPSTKLPVTGLDYAGCADYHHDYEKADTDDILSGERWFLYSMFRKIYSKDKQYEKYYNLFYTYLVIKETIRSELVQTNALIGFDNFAKYQDRKEHFIENTEYEKYYIRMAIKGTLENQPIQYLEARISPKETALENCNAIKKYDRMVGSPDLMNRYFYVFHFIKEEEKREELRNSLHCRHYRKRKSLHKQAVAITQFRERYFEQAKRVRGIDCCSKEIGCRPEVFAQTYRYLSNHKSYYPECTDNYNILHKRIPLLGTTYHIGEDYLDIADGLRAIDEGIRFLKLGCGSRLGHALVLGVDVDEYYQVRKNSILLSQQDYLDNLVWMYYKIKKYGLSGYGDLQCFIEQEYEKYFRNIYRNHMSTAEIDQMCKNAGRYFEKKRSDFTRRYSNQNYKFEISEYYAACKLRGDNPECYIHGYYEEKEETAEWDKYSVDRDSAEVVKIRYNPECAYLYHLYHYNEWVKDVGENVIEVQVPLQYVRCIKEIQKIMCKRIAQSGMGIEVNPSSNYMIGIFKRYDEHPVTRFYNKNLTFEESELYGCPQIPVCINTDDQGVFSTYLDNEYALLALAMEKSKKEDGKSKYQRMNVYAWIDELRRNGINLSFALRGEEKYVRKDHYGNC